MSITIENEEKMKIGPKGQVVIPKFFRKVLGISPGEEILIQLKENKISLEKPTSSVNEFEEIAKAGKSVDKINLKKEYNERMEKKWKKKFT